MIHLVLTDDWELRGDGSGDMRRLQLETLGELLAIFERHGLRASINAEVMQQIAHRRWGAQHAPLGALADAWDETLRDAFRRGHDVQLHIHPQWDDATYVDGRWHLGGDWSMAHGSPARARMLVTEAKGVLEHLLTPIDATYRCVSFRAGAWCLTPSEHLLGVLAEAGIEVDISMIPGVAYRNARVHVDHRGCEEDFWPWWPDPRDARRLGTPASSIVCVPTFTLPESVPRKIVDTLAARLLGRRPCRPNLPPPDAAPAATPSGASDDSMRVWAVSRRQRIARTLTAGTRVVGDLSFLSFEESRRAVARMRGKAAEHPGACVPVVLTCHTKDIQTFEPISQFAAWVAAQPDISVITLRELAGNLRSGLYAAITRRRSVG